MLQRNPHPYALDVPDIPATVQPGATVDWPRLIAGFEPVADASPASELDAAKSPRKKSAPTAAAAGEESTS
ncbi:hypothetical protein FHS39_002594 [Streptomyces olivoverticillatus]|uniref:Uncharacterized protein n=1 Tax=Streptomyces olivoverticillatus TaxID=66427 RepID=A0A7W7LPQ5_9ACTN|nr:hypothetical protein [Streptomyces olivoverticillatus]MBB4893563.1 hypothetical protein [Streptomyces olivoverticillatus]